MVNSAGDLYLIDAVSEDRVTYVWGQYTVDGAGELDYKVIFVIKYCKWCFPGWCNLVHNKLVPKIS